MAESTKAGSEAKQSASARKDTETKDDVQAKEAAGIATVDDNAGLEHSKGGVTTRQDTLDVGVPMLQGSPKEPTGPEDAFGPGQKRGAYEERVHTHSFTSEAVEYDGDDPDNDGLVRDGDGNVVDYMPNTRLVAQTPNASVRGEVEGKKGGVDTTDDD